jgi:hypothetical protein
MYTAITLVPISKQCLHPVSVIHAILEYAVPPWCLRAAMELLEEDGGALGPRIDCVTNPGADRGRGNDGGQCFGEIFPAKVWVRIFPFCTMKVSVPTSKRLSAVSAVHTM